MVNITYLCLVSVALHGSSSGIHGPENYQNKLRLNFERSEQRRYFGLVDLLGGQDAHITVPNLAPGHGLSEGVKHVLVIYEFDGMEQKTLTKRVGVGNFGAASP